MIIFLKNVANMVTLALRTPWMLQLTSKFLFFFHSLCVDLCQILRCTCCSLILNALVITEYVKPSHFTNFHDIGLQHSTPLSKYYKSLLNSTIQHVYAVLYMCTNLQADILLQDLFFCYLDEIIGESDLGSYGYSNLI